MIKNLFLLLIVCFAINSSINAQSGTTSPYSRFGIGDLKSVGSVRSAAMGNTGIGVRNSKRINLMNPVANAAIDSMSFLFDIGVDSKFSRYETNKISEDNYSYSVKYVALAFPVTRWWSVNANLKPYSEVGYEVTQAGSGSDEGSSYLYQGSGGINSVSLGNSFNLFGVSFGANLNYYFGSYSFIKQSTLNLSNTYTTEEQYEQRVKDVCFDFGAQYNLKLKDKMDFTIGAIYRAPIKLGGTKDHNLYKATTSTNPVKYLVYNESNDYGLKLPKKIGFGVSLRKKDKFLIAADYSTEDWENEEFISSNIAKFGKTSNISLGGEYTPDRYAIRGALKRISYRAGFRMSDTYLEVKGEKIKEMGFTFGFGIPLRRSFSTLNIGCEIGQKGTLDSGLIKENYFKFSVGVSLFENWFRKLKYD